MDDKMGWIRFELGLHLEPQESARADLSFRRAQLALLELLEPFSLVMKWTRFLKLKSKS